MPEQRRQRHAVHVAAGRRLRRVHVAVGIHPDQAERPRDGAPHPVRAGRHRSGREAVIAAEHERQRTLVERRAGRQSWSRAADPRDRLDELLCRVGRLAASPGSASAGRPSTTARPSVAIWSPSPAIRNAEGPMSTPRRPAPRSSGTPMMWTGFTRGDCGSTPCHRPATNAAALAATSRPSVMQSGMPIARNPAAGQEDPRECRVPVPRCAQAARDGPPRTAGSDASIDTTGRRGAGLRSRAAWSALHAPSRSVRRHRGRDDGGRVHHRETRGSACVPPAIGLATSTRPTCRRAAPGAPFVARRSPTPASGARSGPPIAECHRRSRGVRHGLAQRRQCRVEGAKQRAGDVGGHGEDDRACRHSGQPRTRCVRACFPQVSHPRGHADGLRRQPGRERIHELAGAAGQGHERALDRMAACCSARNARKTLPR